MVGDAGPRRPEEGEESAGSGPSGQGATRLEPRSPSTRSATEGRPLDRRIGSTSSSSSGERGRLGIRDPDGPDGPVAQAAPGNSHEHPGGRAGPARDDHDVRQKDTQQCLPRRRSPRWSGPASRRCRHAGAPVVTALGPHGVNIMDFCKAYNAQTKSMAGNVIPVEITIYQTARSRSSPTPPAGRYQKAAGFTKARHAAQGEGRSADQGPGPRDRADPLPDLNANDIDAAMKIVEDTARSMGVTTDDRPPWWSARRVIAAGRTRTTPPWQGRRWPEQPHLEKEKDQHAAQQTYWSAEETFDRDALYSPRPRSRSPRPPARELRRDRRRRRCASCRPRKADQMVPRHRQPAPRHRQDGSRARVRERREGRRRREAGARRRRRRQRSRRSRAGGSTSTPSSRRPT